MTSRKKTLLFILLMLIVFAAFAAWRIFGSNTNFTENKKNFYIKTGSSFTEVMAQLEQQDIVKDMGTFKLIAQQLKYDKNIKAGRYVIEQGSSIYRITKILKSGRQTPVNLVINKLRTKEDLAQKLPLILNVIPLQ